MGSNTDPHHNIQGDVVYGDKVSGDKIGRDKIVNNYILPEDRPAIWHGVPDMPTYFLGRTDLINDLAANLTSGNTLALSAEGLPGVGKTAVAVALAHDKRVLAHFSDGVLWAGLGTEPDVMGTLNGWATALGSDVSQMVTPADRSQAVKNLIGQRRLLLVLDDAWEVEAAKLLRCGGPHCTHLLTTRLKDVAHTFAGQTHATVVPELAPAPALALLQAHAPQACAADPDAARKLVTAVGGLPLALELLGGYLGATRRSATPRLSHKALSDMAETENRLALACQRLGDLTGSQVTLNETIALSLAGLAAEPGGTEAADAFYALGAFAPKPADFSWQAACAVADCDEETIAWLLERNLVQQVEEADNLLTLHQSLADVARQQMKPEVAAHHRDYYLSVVNEDRNDWRRIEKIYEQVLWAWENAPQDETLVHFVWNLWQYQSLRGLMAEYMSWVQKALSVTQKTNDFEKLGSMLAHAGFISQSIGDPKTAIQYHSKALQIWQEIEDEKEQAKTLNNIGGVYGRLGQPEEALRYYKEALTIIREVGARAGEGRTLNNIGGVYRRLGLPEEALRYYNEALTIIREVGDRAGEGATLNNIGLIYGSLGQREEALRYYHDALPIKREVGDRAGDGVTLNNIGLVYYSLGQSEEALRYYKEALPIRREVGDRAGEGVTLNNIGLVYHSLEQSEEALWYYHEALPIRREVGDRWGEAVTRYNMLTIYRAQGDLNAAHAEMKLVVELAAAVKSPHLARFQEELAQLEAAMAQK